MRFIGLLLLPSVALAAPVQLSHQGRLLDGLGAPVASEITVEIGIYADTTTLTPLWSESVPLTPEDGYYSVVLGADTDGNALQDSVFTGAPRYVGIALPGDVQPTMRQLLTSVPAAIHATNVSGGEVRLSDTTAMCTAANLGALKFDGVVSVCSVDGWTSIASGGDVAATGGIESSITVGEQDYRLHRFNSGTDTFTVTNGGTVEVLVVGGGGGGGSDLAGGGGAGAVLWVPAFLVAASTYPVSVGAGGAGGGVSRQVNTYGKEGGTSVFGPLSARGGGGGGTYWSGDATFESGRVGGSGGGGGGSATSGAFGVGGAADPGGALGFPGGRAVGGNRYCGGGGGGAGGPGGNAVSATQSGGDGGPGVSVAITGSSVFYGGGGGGSAYCAGSGTDFGTGGIGGGGRGGYGTGPSIGPGVSGSANTGGGGGGGAYNGAPIAGGNGGSGVVIVRYPI